MKTLDEVIKALEYCQNPVDNFGNCNAECPYTNCCDPSNHDVTEDALHYLKEYRSDKAMWEADRKGYLDWIEQYKESREKHQQAVIELKKNPPLTWDELKQMEGKPVWVEADHAFIQYIGWVLIDKIDDSCKDTGMVFTVSDRSEFFLLKDFIGNTWKAYRKERS